MNKATLKYSFMRSLPVMAGYIVLGIGFGVLLADKEKGQIVCNGGEYIVFTDKLLSLDRAKTGYRLNLKLYKSSLLAWLYSLS